MNIDPYLLDEALSTLGEVLEARGQLFEVVAIGGSGLMLLGLVNRPTRDLDALALVEDGAYVSADPLPSSLAEAVASVGRTLGLADDWLNSGPTELLLSASSCTPQWTRESEASTRRTCAGWIRLGTNS